MNRPHRSLLPTRLVAALCAALAVVLLTPATPGWAHNVLRESTPAEGARLGSAPREVTLVFAERLDPRFTTIAVTTADRTEVTAGKPTVSDARATQPLTPALPAGTYMVAYRVVSLDGHPVQGSFTFTTTGAADGAGTAPTAAETTAPASATPTAPTAAPAAGRGEGSASTSVGVGVGVALLLTLVGVAAGVAFWRVRAARR